MYKLLMLKLGFGFPMPNIFLLLYVHPIMNSGAGSKFSLNSSSQDGRSSSPYDDSTSVGALFEGTVSLQIPYFSLSLAKRDASTENSEQWQRIRCGSFGCFLLLLIQVDEWCSFSGSSGTQTSLQSTWIRGIFLV